MDFDDYLREQAVMYRALAEEVSDECEQEELRDLALACEEIADNIEDRLTGG